MAGRAVTRAAGFGDEACTVERENAPRFVVAPGGGHREARGALLDALFAE